MTSTPLSVFDLLPACPCSFLKSSSVFIFPLDSPALPSRILLRCSGDGPQRESSLSTVPCLPSPQKDLYTTPPHVCYRSFIVRRRSGTNQCSYRPHYPSETETCRFWSAVYLSPNVRSSERGRLTRVIATLCCVFERIFLH